jgi:PDZ domain-containing secreted protein
LRSKSYSSLSIDAAIHKWAPAADNNDPVRYAKDVEKLTGLSANKKINSLDDQELNKVANAIRTVEGWKPGKEQKI